MTPPGTARRAPAGLLRALELSRLPAVLAAVSVGGALAVGEPVPRWPVWAAVALAGLFVQLAGRLLVEAADLRRARAHPWQSGRRLSAPPPGRLTGGAVFCFAVAALVGALATIERGWPLFWLGAGAFGLAIAYSHGPALRDRALGPPLSFLLLGPLPVVAGYLAVTGAWSPLALRASVPLGLLAAAAVLAREIRDVVDDGRAGVVTLAGLMRRPAADFLLLGLLAAAYLWLLGLVTGGMLAPVCLIPGLTLPGAFRLFALVRSTPEAGTSDVASFPDRAARLYIVFAILYAASVAVSEIVWKRPV